VKHVNFVLKSLLGLVVLMLLVGALTAPALAAAKDEDGRDYAGLEYALKWMVLRLDAQQDNLDNARAAADLAEEYIADEQAAGYDTSALEAALADARAKLDEAQGFHDTAAQILEEKAGFDDEGNVVDPQQARDTLKNARQAMQDANQSLLEARRDFRRALQDYRQSKHDE
jgi:ElaB/YqjD/DUF883 family membrane-anchored ribosome-binding protein